MASTLYDSDGAILIVNDAVQVAGMLASGRYYSSRPEARPVASSTNKTSSKDIRNMAKMLGYDDWDTAKVSELRARI